MTETFTDNGDFMSKRRAKEKTMTEPFWMIYGQGQSEPRATHHSFEVAKREAERLARVSPGIKFYVLQSIACAVKQDIEFRRIPIDEIPF